ncbi:MAG: Hsp20/alpha crystallin family protein [Patescibacteria group bacterium]|nr:Hsp20/alpha crystallin family protein [Patescibacteria group bacterium]
MWFKNIKQQIDSEENAKKDEITQAAQAGNGKDAAGFEVVQAMAQVEVVKSNKTKKEEKSGKKAGKEKTERETILAKSENSPEWMEPSGQLAVDVYQTDNAFVVQAPIAGVDPENIDIAVEGEMLVIKGQRKEQSAEAGKQYFHQECYWGAFVREIMLPEDVDASKIKASLKNGILLVQVPRKKGEKKKIVVEIG